MKKKVIALSVLAILVILTLSACTTTEDTTKKVIFMKDNEIYQTVEVLEGDKLSMPTPPTSDKFDFDGWYLDNGAWENLVTTNLFNDKSLGNEVKVYAKWKDKQADVLTYKVTYNSMGGNEITPIIANENDTVSEPANITKTGFTLKGWYTSKDNGKTLNTAWDFSKNKVTENITLYANWTVNTYSITFETNNGTAITPKTFDYNSKITLGTTTRTGYTFSGWYRDEALSVINSLTYMPSDNVVLYAKWIPIQYKITYVTNGGTTIKTQNIDYDSLLSLESTTRKGYNFDGWYTNANLTNEFTDTKMPNNNLILYAGWSAINYKLTFETNGGDAIPVQEYTYNSSIYLPTPTKAGSTFLGWYTNSNLTISFNLVNMPDSDVKIYAKWSLKTYTINYMTNGGSTIGQQNYKYNDNINYGYTTRDNYNFVSWHENSNLTDAPFNLAYMPARNITLYAKWEIKKYTLTIKDATVQENELLTIIIDYGTNIATYLADESISDKLSYTKGHIFDGWKIKDGSIFVDLPSDAIMSENGFTVYATSQLVRSSIIFNANGGTGTAITLNNVEYNTLLLSVLVNINNPFTAPIGFKFDGWQLLVSGTAGNSNAVYENIKETDKMPSNNLTIYAKWVRIKYTLNILDKKNDDILGTFEVEYGTSILVYLTENNIKESDDLTIPEGQIFKAWQVKDALVFSDLTDTPTMGTEGFTVYIDTTTRNLQAILYVDSTNSISFTVDIEYGKNLVNELEAYKIFFTPPQYMEFDCWQILGDGSIATDITALDTMPDNNIEVIIKWKDIVN